MINFSTFTNFKNVYMIDDDINYISKSISIILLLIIILNIFKT